MKKNLTFFLFWFMITIGIHHELSPYTMDVMTGSQYGIAFICICLTLLYIIPASLLLENLRKRWTLDRALPILGLLAGAFIAGWMSSYGNGLMDWILGSFLSGKTLDTWLPPTAALIEEPAKAFAAFAVLFYLYGHNFKPKQVLMAGITAGLGFQIIEDFSYINNNVFQGFSYSVADIFIRMAGAIGSHWTYTAMTTFGIYLFLSKDSQPANKKFGLTLLVASFLLHLVWNTPIVSIKLGFPLIEALICALCLLGVKLAYDKAQELEA